MNWLLYSEITLEKARMYLPTKELALLIRLLSRVIKRKNYNKNWQIIFKSIIH